MYNIKIFKILFCLLTALFFCNRAHSGENSEGKLHFRGTISDSKSRDITHIVVGYIMDENFHGGDSNRSFSINVDKSGRFNFSLPDLGKPFWFAFSLKGPDKSIRLDPSYFAESGDNIDIKIRIGVRDTLMFSGKGAAKYNLVETLKDIYFGGYFHSVIRNGMMKIDDPILMKQKLKEFSDLVGECEKRKTTLISNSGLGPKMKSLIKFEYANFYNDWFDMITYSLYENANEEIRKLLQHYYLTNLDHFFYKPTNLSMMSNGSVLVLAEKIKFDLKISNKTTSIDLVSYYNALKNNESTYIRDRLIGHLVTNKFGLTGLLPYNESVLDSIIRDASIVVNVPYVKRVISKKLNLDKGSKLFFASFNDVNGKIVNTDSFKGKVVLIDIWFLGCSGCAQFHEKFENDVYPFLKDYQDFEVLSINIDKAKANWVKGIESNLYTSKSYINVNANAGLDHPFMKYYGITGGPYLLLIDINGNIYSRLEPLEGTDLNKMKELINGALSIKKDY